MPKEKMLAHKNGERKQIQKEGSIKQAIGKKVKTVAPYKWKVRYVVITK